MYLLFIVRKTKRKKMLFLESQSGEPAANSRTGSIMYDLVSVTAIVNSHFISLLW